MPGGMNNEAAGIKSLAAGYRAKATHDGAFVWADQSDFDFSSVLTDEFAARCVGGVRFVTGIDGSGNPNAGVQVPAGGGSWSSISDRNLKENFVAVNGEEILEKLVALTISSWNYRSQDSSIRHIGPTAQDLYALFGFGENEKHIATVDADGIALAAIQELYQENIDLKKRVEQLEVIVQGLLAERQ